MFSSMNVSGRLQTLIGLLLLFPLFVVAQSAPPAAPPAVLPQQFGGWTVKDPVIKSTDPVAADETNAPVLKEYGFQRLEKATYTRDDGRKLDIKAAVFDDASGAYGAFTYYKIPEMLNEKIGGQASSLNNRVLFYQGNVLVDAVFDKLSGVQEEYGEVCAGAGDAGPGGGAFGYADGGLQVGRGSGDREVFRECGRGDFDADLVSDTADRD